MIRAQDIAVGDRIVVHAGLVSAQVMTVVSVHTAPGGLYCVKFDTGHSGGYYHNVEYTSI